MHERPVDGTAARLALELRELHVAVSVDDLTAEVPLVVVDSEQSRVVMPILDSWTLRLTADVRVKLEAAGLTALPVRFDGGLALVGPLIGGSDEGCWDCAERWRRESLGGGVPADQALLTMGGMAAPGVLAPIAALALTVLTDPGANAARLWAFKGDDLTCSTHTVRAIGGCPGCRPLLADNADDAHVELLPRPIPAGMALRQANPATQGTALRDALFDWRLGPVVSLYRTERSQLSLVSAILASGERAGADEGGFGRSATYADSERIALFEALERYCSWQPRGKRTSRLSSFSELGPDEALDPLRLGLHHPRYADDPRFGLASYDPQLPTKWVHGWSFGRDRPILVPEQVAYWGPTSPRGTRFLYETSNGCGLGNSREEATLYGLFEVCERDAFLMAWYARTPLTPVAVPVEDPLVLHVADHLDLLGYDLLIFDSTNDLGVPAVVAVARHRDPSSSAPQTFVAAGAHLDPRRAIAGAVIELAVNVANAPGRASGSPRQVDPAVLRSMLVEPERVLSLEDHVWMNALPEARERFDFLTTGIRTAAPWQEVWPRAANGDMPDDLTPVLRRLLTRLTDLRLDVIVVDQSEPWSQRRLGLACVKVLVPGTLPMTFGHVHHRTLGLPRLLEVPYQLGRAPQPLSYESLALHPHPFP